jgi:hypothetical protein
MLAVYLSQSSRTGIPTANLFVSIAVCIAGLVLSGMALRGRGSWREVASFAIPALVGTVAALRFGPAGAFFVLAVAYVSFLSHRWWRARQLASSGKSRDGR